ncbi:3862_t:CDS:2, partial [Funneliformis mosseae]
SRKVWSAEQLNGFLKEIINNIDKHIDTNTGSQEMGNTRWTIQKNRKAESNSRSFHRESRRPLWPNGSSASESASARSLRKDGREDSKETQNEHQILHSSGQYTNIHLREFLGLGSSSTVYKVKYNDTQADLKYYQDINLITRHKFYNSVTFKSELESFEAKVFHQDENTLFEYSLILADWGTAIRDPFNEQMLYERTNLVCLAWYFE